MGWIESAGHRGLTMSLDRQRYLHAGERQIKQILLRLRQRSHWKLIGVPDDLFNPG